MTCNYFRYKEITDKAFYGVTQTDKHLNNATEEIRRYLVDGGAGEILQKLGIGIRVIEKQFIFPELNEVVENRFVFISGENKGRELTRQEIEGIGLFLKHGMLYGKI